jgi:hypothetical protein
MAVAARNAVCRGPVFRRRATMLASRSLMLASRSLMLASRSLMHGWSHCDAHLAHLETRFVAARRAIRHKRFTACRAATHRSSQRGAALVTLRRRVIAPWRGECRTATSRTSERARTTPRCASRTSERARTTTRCGESDIRAREDNDALWRGGLQSARGQRRAVARWTSERARTTPRCDEANIRAREMNVALRHGACRAATRGCRTATRPAHAATRSVSRRFEPGTRGSVP